MSKEKPFLSADKRSDVDRFDPKLQMGGLDPSRIPGYSEIVQANDVAKADALYFREQNGGRTKEEVLASIGAEPMPLDVEFAWLPVSGATGLNAAGAIRQLDFHTNREGFRPASKDDLASRGYGFPPTARVAEDGTIRRGADLALYIRSGDVARAWESYKAAETAKREQAHLPEEFKEGGYVAPTLESTSEHEVAFLTH